MVKITCETDRVNWKEMRLLKSMPLLFGSSGVWCALPHLPSLLDLLGLSLFTGPVIDASTTESANCDFAANLRFKEMER